MANTDEMTHYAAFHLGLHLLQKYLFRAIQNEIGIPYMTGNTIWKSDKNTKKHITQESQEVKPFPAGDQKATRNRPDRTTKINMNNKKDPQKKQRLG